MVKNIGLNKMKLAAWKILPIVLGIVFSCNLIKAQDRRIELTAGNIGISFVLPVELQPFSDEKMALIREKGVAAKFIFSDKLSDVTLAINTFGYNANEKGLSEVGEHIKAGAEQQTPQAEVLKRDIITMNGRKWLRLLLKEKATDDDLISSYFVTDWAGEYVLFNFSSTITKYEGYQSEFERIARSIQLEFISNSIELDKGALKHKPKKTRH